MAEFGENLKKVREEKGMTQQTLADYLYVTRQAVSRWEGGSRYPDLLTAKKIAQYLEVSLDDLLSDDDMKLYVEKNAILDSPVAKRTQLVLISVAFMCSLVLTIIYLCNHFIHDNLVLESPSETMKNVLLTIILCYGSLMAIYDKLTAKIAVVLSSLYFGTAILTGVYGLFLQETTFTNIFLAGATTLNVTFLMICLSFFGSKKLLSPIPLYITAGVYCIIGIINFLYGFTLDIPNEIYRDVFTIHLFALIQNILVLSLLSFMAYTLNRKRKLTLGQ